MPLLSWFLENLIVNYSLSLTFLCLPIVHTSVRAASNMVEVFVDGKPVEVEPGTTVLQVHSNRLFCFSHLCIIVEAVETIDLCICWIFWTVFLCCSFVSLAGLWEGRNPNPPVLLPRAPLSGGKLSHVSGWDRESSKGIKVDQFCFKTHYSTFHLKEDVFCFLRKRKESAQKASLFNGWMCVCLHLSLSLLAPCLSWRGGTSLPTQKKHVKPGKNINALFMIFFKKA